MRALGSLSISIHCPQSSAPKRALSLCKSLSTEPTHSHFTLTAPHSVSRDLPVLTSLSPFAKQKVAHAALLLTNCASDSLPLPLPT